MFPSNPVLRPGNRETEGGKKPETDGQAIMRPDGPKKRGEQEAARLGLLLGLATRRLEARAGQHRHAGQGHPVPLVDESRGIEPDRGRLAGAG